MLYLVIIIIESWKVSSFIDWHTITHLNEGSITSEMNNKMGVLKGEGEEIIDHPIVICNISVVRY